MEDIEKIPQELQLKPKCLIYLTGLDVDNNHSHATVWKSFSQNRRSDRAPLKFRNVPVDHQYPKSVSKPSRYEWYQPKGLIKRKWMRKHLDELPAVVAIFFDLEWDEKLWQGKLAECVRRVETVRSNLQSRDTKVVVVLLQKRAPVPVGNDLNATERAQNLCSTCDLPVKHLFVLQLTGFMFGCITRLETEMHDMASNYYHNAAKRVKSHRTSLNKTNHQLLFVRHEFKIAFFDELKQDQNLALKHYRQAYNNLLELRVHDLHLLEVKVVAGFINYKICRLFFQLQASESIAQFRRHIDFFTNLVGMPELAFEHEAWLSKQFEVFGELFDDATRLSVNPLLTQHPGLYYQEAARHTEARRRLALRLCQPEEAATAATSAGDSGDLAPTSAPSPDRSTTPGSVVRVSPAPPAPAPLPADSLMSTAEFYGQRPWRRPGHNLDVAEAAQERRGIRFAQATEAAVVHSNLIIPMLACACRYFERYKAARMKLYPAFAIAEEYLRKEDYENALSQYVKVTEEFRSGDWSLLFTSVCSRLFECARKVGNHVLSVSSALELLGPHSTLNEVEKLRIQELIFQDVDLLQVDWNLERQDVSSTEVPLNRLTVDATHLRSCIDVRAEFLKPSFSVDERVPLLIYMKSFAPLPLTVHSVTVNLIHKTSPSSIPFVRETEDVPGVPVDGSHSVYTTRCEWPVPLQLLSSDGLKAICFDLDPQVLASTVQIESLELTLLSRTPSGQSQKCTVTWSMLVLAPLSAEALTPTDGSCNYTARVAAFKNDLAKLCIEPPSAEKSLDLMPKWEHLTNRSVARINPRQSKLELNLRHCPPVLCNEEYAVLCCVQNTEASAISSFVLKAYLSERSAENAPESVPGRESQSAANDQAGFVVLGQYQAQLQRNSGATPTAGASSEAPIGDTLAADSEFVCPIFLRCPSPGDRSLRVDASYRLRIPVQPPQATVFTCTYHKKTDGKKGCFVEISPLSHKPKVAQSIIAKCIQSKRVQLSVLPPFDFSWRILSLQHALITTIIPDKPFVLEASLRNASPWNIEITYAKPVLGPGVDFLDGKCDPQLTNVCLQSSEVATGVQVLIVLDSNANTDFVNLGHYVVRWRRLRPQQSQEASFPESSFSQTDLKPLSCHLADLPFNVELQMPAQALVHTPLLLKYTLENKTSFLQELTVSMDSVPSFMFCGRQLVSTRLLPNSSQELDFTLLPLRAGYLELPRFSVRSGDRSLRDSLLDPTAAADLARASAKDRMLRQLRSHIFVLPLRQMASTGN